MTENQLLCLVNCPTKDIGDYALVKGPTPDATQLTSAEHAILRDLY